MLYDTGSSLIYLCTMACPYKGRNRIHNRNRNHIHSFLEHHLQYHSQS
jgi:hypothetical protein